MLRPIALLLILPGALAVARRTLRDVDRRPAAAAGSRTLNAYMAAHAEESRARITKPPGARLKAEG